MDEILTASQPYVTLVKDVITIISIIAATVVAFMGLQTWKNQLVGTVEYELAKRILKATYRLRDVLENVRNPLILAEEEYRAAKESNLDNDSDAPDVRRRRSEAVYNNRWKDVVSNFQDLQLTAAEAEAVWGTEVKDKLLGIRVSVMNLYTAIQMFHLYAFRPNPDEKIQEIVRTFEKIVYKSSVDVPDDYSTNLLAELAVIERAVRPYLKRNRHK